MPRATRIWRASLLPLREKVAAQRPDEGSRDACRPSLANCRGGEGRWRAPFQTLALLTLCLPLAACGAGPAPTTFDLSAPRDFGRISASRVAIVVNEPSTVQALDSDRMIVRDAAGALSFLGGAQWADRVPKLVQTRLIQTFENASRIAAVSRPGERIVADLQLNTDIRGFNVDATTGSAVVEITAKLVTDRTGRIQRAKVFAARIPLATVEGASAAQGLDQALSQVLIEIVRWAA